MTSANEWIDQYGYLAVLIGTAIEGDGIAVLAGIAARHGYLNLLFTIVATALGGALSDIGLYFVGRRYGDAIIRRFSKHRERIERARSLILRHERLWIIGLRFAYGFRIIGPIIIGSSGIPVRRFLLLNMLGTVLWAVTVVVLGYWVGDVLHRIFAGHPRLEIWLLVIAAWIALLAFAVHRFRRRRQI
ncbi:DedA family protein [Azomonas macrocytogenes]|uniref:Membrane protein DedA with SNARE-associated domain n=1 Tax=Azomonas macrocytogenes TaxID=69962 RepID=A0A839T5W2_AZOMA|nr:DedA family protein [Azomonas macrocytogenes]MBB3103325.1 membrane protein DedA with SNARE-associated domain [Azomonas macrocytogenes]